jgi:ABC-type glycerol-3-phosphate transport system substrate-binding protein
MAAAFTPENMAGAVSGALGTAYPDCVSRVFAGGGRTAMVFEGDFALGAIQSLGLSLTPGPAGDYDFFRFPAVDRSAPPAVVVGGDMAVMLRDTPEARELINYLATPDAGRAWARQGGFISPHRDVRGADYANQLSRQIAAGLAGNGTTLEFDMSDRAPVAFGSTAGAGEWEALQRWAADTSTTTATQEQLEAAARQAYSTG